MRMQYRIAITFAIGLATVSGAQLPRTPEWYDSTLKRFDHLMYVYRDSQGTEYGKHGGSTRRYGHLELMALMYGDSSKIISDQRAGEAWAKGAATSPSLTTPSPLVIALILDAIVCALIGGLLLAATGRGWAGAALGALLGPLGVIVAAILRLEPRSGVARP